MRRGIWAVGLGLALGGAAPADDAVNLGRFQPTAGGLGGGTDTPADTQKVFHKRSAVVVYGGYYPAYGFAYPAYYGGFYAPYYAAPVYGGWGYGGWGYPAYSYGFGYSYGYAGFGYGWGYPAYYGGYFPIRGEASETPTVTLGTARPLPTVPADTAPVSAFRYDGGPSAPVPQPAPEAPRATPVGDEPAAIRIGRPAPSDYRFPAYGEKR